MGPNALGHVVVARICAPEVHVPCWKDRHLYFDHHMNILSRTMIDRYGLRMIAGLDQPASLATVRLVAACLNRALTRWITKAQFAIAKVCSSQFLCLSEIVIRRLPRVSLRPSDWVSCGA